MYRTYNNNKKQLKRANKVKKEILIQFFLFKKNRFLCLLQKKSNSFKESSRFLFLQPVSSWLCKMYTNFIRLDTYTDIINNVCVCVCVFFLIHIYEYRTCF